MRWRLCIAAACAAALGIVAAAHAAGPSLEGEDLTAPSATFTSTYSCNTAGTSTVSWTAQGVATGPYPGTFTASGTLTIGPQTLPGNIPGTGAGPIGSFEETFTIQSGTTMITGSKTLNPDAGSGTIGTCEEVTGFSLLDVVNGQGTIVDVGADTLYEAEIQALDGTTTDHGIAFVSLSDINITGPCPAGMCQVRTAHFNQTFNLSMGPLCDEDHQGNQDEDPGCDDDDEN